MVVVSAAELKHVRSRQMLSKYNILIITLWVSPLYTRIKSYSFSIMDLLSCIVSFALCTR